MVKRNPIALIVALTLFRWAFGEALADAGPRILGLSCWQWIIYSVVFLAGVFVCIPQLREIHARVKSQSQLIVPEYDSRSRLGKVWETARPYAACFLVLILAGWAVSDIRTAISRSVAANSQELDMLFRTNGYVIGDIDNFMHVQFQLVSITNRSSRNMNLRCSLIVHNRDYDRWEETQGFWNGERDDPHSGVALLTIEPDKTVETSLIFFFQSWLPGRIQKSHITGKQEDVRFVVRDLVTGRRVGFHMLAGYPPSIDTPHDAISSPINDLD